MDANEVDPESATTPPVAAVAGASPQPPVDTARPSRLRSLWRGTKTGFRWTSYVFGPIAGPVAIAGVALTLFGFGSGRGWGVHRMLPGAFAFYFAWVLWGVILGAVLGLIGSLVPRGRPNSRWAKWWSAANRPIQFIRRRRAEAAPRPSRPRRWPLFIGAPVLLVLLTAFGVGVYLGRAVDRRLAAAISAANRDDPFWQLNDLMAHRDPVPDAENSALVVAEALSLLPENWPAGPAPPPGYPSPPPTEPAKAFNRMPEAPNVQLDDAVADTLRGELDACNEAVRIARSVADLHRGRHELELGPTLIDTSLPETKSARTAAKLLVVDAAIRAHDGDLDGALDSCRAILGVGRSIGDEPFLISQLVRAAAGMVAMKSARRVLGQGEPSDEALARLQALVLDELAQPLLLHGFKGERATLTELIRRVGTGEVPISALSENSPPFDPDRPRAAVAPWGRLWFDNQRAVALEWSNEVVAIARRTPAARPPLWKAWEAEVERVKLGRFSKYTALLPLLHRPAFESAELSQSHYQSELGATAILLAAERHRLKTGDWPASIAAIDPTILPNPPGDPFTGGPFHMERRDGQLLVHSVGPNLKDEHGKYDPKPSTRGGPDDFGTGAWDVDRRRQPPSP